jgi:hypothetical protein
MLLLHRLYLGCKQMLLWQFVHQVARVAKVVWTASLLLLSSFTEWN